MASFSRTTWLSRHQKGKPFWILPKQEMTEWQWHQLDHMQIICTSLQTENHTHISAQNKPDNLPSYPPHNYHCSDAVYRKVGGSQTVDKAAAHDKDATFWATVCKTVRPMLSVRCLSVCVDVRALWPNGWMDQDETWHAGRPRPWPHC